MNADTPAGLMADGTFMAQVHAGDHAALSRWSAAHQAAEQAAPSRSGGEPSSTTAPSAADAAAAIRTRMTDRAWMARLDHGDPAALREWDALHMAAYPDNEPTNGAPPAPEHYVMPAPLPGAIPAPELEAAFRSAASSFGLSIDAAAELVDVYNRVGAMAAYMSDADIAEMDADAAHQLQHEPEILEAARRSFAKLQHEHPEVSSAVHEAGCLSNVDFVRLLARHAGR